MIVFVYVSASDGGENRLILVNSDSNSKKNNCILQIPRYFTDSRLRFHAVRASRQELCQSGRHSHAPVHLSGAARRFQQSDGLCAEVCLDYVLCQNI